MRKGTRNGGRKTENGKRKTENEKPRHPFSENRDLKIENRKSKVESRKSKIENQGRNANRQLSNSNDQTEDSAVRASHSAASIFGVLPVLEALRANVRRIEKIFVAEGAQERRLGEIFELAKQLRVPFQKIPRANLARYTEAGANHQGVVAFVAAADYVGADELLDQLTAKIAASEKPLAVVLDGLEDPRNLGAILRTVDCVGADGVFIPERRAVGLTETVAKTSAGATEYVKTAKVTNIGNLIEKLKERNIWTIGTSADAKMDYTEWDWTQSSALVLGGEGRGLHRLVAEKCDVLVKIPLHGKIESLNVSVAAGVILYEARRRRNLQQWENAEEKVEGKEE